MILSGLFGELVNTPAIVAIIGANSVNPSNAVFFGAAGKEPPPTFVVINVDSTPAATTLDQTTALQEGELQFDCYASSQMVARQLATLIQDLFEDFDGTLTDGTTIQFVDVNANRDLGYEVGGESYLFRTLLRMHAFYTESAVAPTSSQFYEGEGAPTTLHNNGDLYYDELTGNLWEQNFNSWSEVANIPQGGGDMQPSNDFHLVAVAGTNTNVLKNSAGLVTGWKISNNAGYPIYVKLFNLAAAPTLGSSVPAQTIGVQAGEDAEVSINGGLTYSAGIAIAITKGIADGDSTAVAANDCVVDVFWQ